MFLFLAVLGAALQLQPGIPVQGRGNEGETVYYTIPLQNQNNDLRVTVTPTSGDPDLYISLTDSTPDSTSPWKSVRYGGDEVIVPATNFSAFTTAYIGVASFLPGAYTIVATFNHPISLLDGVPQHGTVIQGDISRYEFQISTPQPPRDITITAVPLEGNLQLFVGTQGDVVPGQSSTFSWSTPSGYTGEPLIIRNTDQSWPANGHFYIALVGVTRATFSIVAATNHSHTFLRFGIPQQDTAATGESQYYLVDVARPGCSLSIGVTPITGDPDLFVSRDNMYPNPANSGQSPDDRASRLWGSDEISYDIAKPGPYYVGVEAWERSSFTITASLSCNSTSTITTLVDGVPTQADLLHGHSRYYQLRVLTGHKDISISVARISGDPDLYVRDDGQLPSPTFWQWRSDTYGSDSIYITDSSPNFCSHCNYTIAVYASTDCRYSLQASTSNAISLLQIGVPRVDSLSSSEYEYFRLPVHQFTRDLTITVTPFGLGDPDIYVSTLYQFPNQTFFSWSATSFGADSVTIPHTDPRACSDCTYYIAVRGFLATTFSIVATAETTTTLQAGVPQYGAVTLEATKYYSYRPGTTQQDVTFYLSTTSGYTKLYGSRTLQPTRDTHEWEGSGAGAVQSFTLSRGGPLACNTSACFYNIAVYGISNATFSLTVSTAYSTKRLQPGISERGSVAQRGWDYYSIHVDSPNNGLSVVLTSLSGNPDLFISRSNSRPNATSYDYRSTRQGSDVVDIPEASVGSYYIAVYGIIPSTFTVAALLTVAGDDKAVVPTLLNGEPQHASVQTGHYRYFSFSLQDTHNELTFTVAVSVGSVRLYCNTGTYPNSTSHRWSSSSNMLTVTHPGAGRYILGVYAISASDFSVTASTEYAVINLQDGVALRATLAAHEYRYYTLTVNSARDVTVSVTPFEGDPDLYISTSGFPSTTNATWVAETYMADSVTISSSDEHFKLGVLYISVYAFLSTSYTITATLTRPTQLQDGVPQSGSVAKHALVYYTLRPGIEHASVTVTATPTSGTVTLLVSVNREPTLTSYQWWSSDYATIPSLTIGESDPARCVLRNCTYYIGVYGSSAAQYSIIASTNLVSKALLIGVPIHASINAQEYEHFYFEDSFEGFDLTFVLTALSGDPDLFVATNGYPNLTSYTWVSSGYGSDAVGINAAAKGTYFLSVYGFQNASFTLVAYSTNRTAEQSTTALIDGVPQSGLLNGIEYKYYSIVVGSGIGELRITVTPQLGDPDIYVNNNGTLPTTAGSQWSSRMYGADTVRIASPAAGQYLVAVYAFSTCQYTITADTSDIVTLQMNVPFRREVDGSTYAYFRLAVDRTDEDLTVTVTPLGDGDPDLFISSRGRANSSFYEWAARSYRSDSITIPSEELRIGDYYISVYGFRAAFVTVLASLSFDVQLSDGFPQGGVVDFEGANYYRFLVSQSASRVGFSLRTYGGFVSLFVGLTHKPDVTNTSSYQWSFYSLSSYDLTISDNPIRCTTAICTYYVLVTGASNHTSYTLTASTTDMPNVLQTGIAVRGSVAKGSYDYYSFYLGNPTAEVQFTVTSLSGDPDLYVSVHNPRPSNVTYDWASFVSGGDAVGVDYTMDNYVVGVYYVAVYGFSSASYSIIATVADLSGVETNATTMLYEGVPQEGLLRREGQWAYFTFHAVNARHYREIDIVVTAISGDPDLYVTADASRPTITHYNWSSTMWGSDSVRINNPCVGLGRDCMTELTVGVVAFRHTVFSVVVRTEAGETVLQNGVSLRDQVGQDDASYYRFRVDSNDQPLVVMLTSLTGDPDLFISTTFIRPNASFCTWCATDFGDDVVAIQNPAPGDYYIGVSTWNQASTYTITATVGPITLTPGQPLKDKLAEAEIREYIVRVSNAATSQEVVISLDMYYGTANVTVDSRGFPDDVQGPWGNWTAQDSVRVPITNPASCPCTFYVQVRALSTSSFTITASLGGATHRILVSGVPVTTEVSQDNWVYFRALVEAESREVNVELTTFVGDVAIYISSVAQFPDSSTSSWSLGSPNTHLALAIDPASGARNLYFGVQGRRASRFSLLLSTRSVRLKAGTPQTAVLSATGNFFYATVNIPTQVDGTPQSEITFTANIVDQHDATTGLGVCVSTRVAEPSEAAGNCMWSRTLLQDEALIIAKNSPLLCPNCTYYISVTAPPELSGSRIIVKLTTEDRAEVLVDGTMVRGQKSSGAYNYYEMWVGQSSGLEVSLSTCEGDADLYVSKGTYRPDKDHYEWASEQRQAVDVVRIRELESHALFYIGVATRTPNTNYFLVAKTSNQPTVESPQPANEGKLMLSTPGAGLVRVEFGSALAPKGYDGRLFYTVYFAKDNENRVMYTECGVRKTSSNGRAPAWETTVVRFIGGLEPRTVYTINVLVETENKATAIYQSAQIETLASADLGPKKTPWGWILGLGIPILLGLIVLVAFLYFRNRRLTQAVSVEMEGIPNAAVQKAIAGPPSARNDKAFSALLGPSAVVSDDGEADSRRGQDAPADIEQPRHTAL